MKDERDDDISNYTSSLHGDGSKLIDSLLNCSDELDFPIQEPFSKSNINSLSPWIQKDCPPKKAKLKKSKKVPEKIQDDTGVTYGHAGSGDWPEKSRTGRKSCDLGVESVEILPWKIGVEPGTYRYMPNNGRYRALKLAKKETTASTYKYNKVSSKVLSPTQKHLQKEIQRELRKEFELATQKQSQNQNQITSNVKGEDSSDNANTPAELDQVEKIMVSVNNQNSENVKIEKKKNVKDAKKTKTRNETLIEISNKKKSVSEQCMVRLQNRITELNKEIAKDINLKEDPFLLTNTAQSLSSSRKAKNKPPSHADLPVGLQIALGSSSLSDTQLDTAIKSESLSDNVFSVKRISHAKDKRKSPSKRTSRSSTHIRYRTTSGNYIEIPKVAHSVDANAFRPSHNGAFENEDYENETIDYGESDVEESGRRMYQNSNKNGVKDNLVQSVSSKSSTVGEDFYEERNVGEIETSSQETDQFGTYSSHRNSLQKEVALSQGLLPEISGKRVPVKMTKQRMM